MKLFASSYYKLFIRNTVPTLRVWRAWGFHPGPKRRRRSRDVAWTPRRRGSASCTPHSARCSPCTGLFEHAAEQRQQLWVVYLDFANAFKLRGPRGPVAVAPGVERTRCRLVESTVRPAVLCSRPALWAVGSDPTD